MRRCGRRSLRWGSTSVCIKFCDLGRCRGRTTNWPNVTSAARARPMAKAKVTATKRLPALVTVLRRTNSRPRLDWADGAVSAALIRRLPRPEVAAGPWHVRRSGTHRPSEPSRRPSGSCPTPRDRRDVARPSNATGSSPHDDDGQAKDQLTPALSRTGLRPVGDHGRGPAEAAAPASAPVAGPVVGFGSWSDPDPDAAADPDPPPGTRVLPGHHSRAGHSRARLNGQHPGRGPAPAGVRFATRPPRHSAEPRSSQRCWWADDPAGDRDCFWPGGVRGELLRIPTRCADGRGHPGGAPDQPDHTAGRAGARTGDLNRRGGV